MQNLCLSSRASMQIVIMTERHHVMLRSCPYPHKTDRASHKLPSSLSAVTLSATSDSEPMMPLSTSTTAAQAHRAAQ